LKKTRVFILPILIILWLLYLRPVTGDRDHLGAKINGVNLVGTSHKVDAVDLSDIELIKADWVSVVPYAFSNPGRPEIYFNTKNQWWGERREGVASLSSSIRLNDMKIMIKPHVWVKGEGWPGNFELQTDEEWLIWENEYGEYILGFAGLAESLEAEIFCIGTEYRKAAVNRVSFWRDLILQVRKVYNGKITYAANWDNYDNISFWDQLDYIGIDAYFPLSRSRTPSVKELVNAWDPIKNDLKKFSEKHNKPILFTEYGYQSCDYNCSGHWDLENKAMHVNMISQRNAYSAFYKTFWDKEWVAGGFLWKWYPEMSTAGGSLHKEYTPQNKPAQEIVKKYYNLTKSF
jgi:hypothetical protein